MSFDGLTLFAYAIGLFLLYVLMRCLLLPTKVMMRFIGNALVGGGLLAGLNFLGASFGFYLPLNPLAALCLGLLGIPGLLLLLILHYLTIN